jgi:Sec-independent protein translocase protein TatA
MYEPLVWFLFTMGVILLIVFVLLAVFAPWVLPRIFKGVTSAGKAVREVTKKEKGG